MGRCDSGKCPCDCGVPDDGGKQGAKTQVAKLFRHEQMPGACSLRPCALAARRCKFRAHAAASPCRRPISGLLDRNSMTWLERLSSQRVNGAPITTMHRPTRLSAAALTSSLRYALTSHFPRLGSCGQTSAGHELSSQECGAPSDDRRDFADATMRFLQAILPRGIRRSVPRVHSRRYTVAQFLVIARLTAKPCNVIFGARPPRDF